MTGVGHGGGPAIQSVDRRCPTCGAVLGDADHDPEATFRRGRMRMDIACPGCEAPRTVIVEATVDDTVRVRKRVEPTDAVDAHDANQASCALAPVDEEERTVG